MRLSIAAFTETPERAEAVRAAVADHRLRKSRLTLEAGGLAAAADRLAEMDSPQLLILETTLGGSALEAALEPVAAAVGPDTRVVILGAVNDIGLYRRLIGLGVSEYLVGPQDADSLIEAFRAIFGGDTGEAAGRLIAVYGAEGGVGTSTVAANLAYALGKAVEEEVILVDLDLWFGTAALALNLTPRQTVVDALMQPDRIDAVLLERFLLKVNDRLGVLAAPAQPGINHDINGPALDYLLTILRQDAPFVVVDLPHQWTPWVREVLLEANELVLVAYPDLANLRDATAILAQVAEARGVGAPNRLVFNRVGAARKGELTDKDFEEALKLAPAVSIPFDPAAFGQAMNNGEPLAQSAPSSPAARAFETLAWTVSGRNRPAAAVRRKGLGLSLSLARSDGSKAASKAASKPSPPPRSGGGLLARLLGRG